MPLFLDIHNLVDDLPPMEDIFEMHKVDLMEASKINADISTVNNIAKKLNKAGLLKIVN